MGKQAPNYVVKSMCHYSPQFINSPVGPGPAQRARKSNSENVRKQRGSMGSDALPHFSLDFRHRTNFQRNGAFALE